MSTPKEDDNLCHCGKNPKENWHECPYASDVHDNHDQEHCQCCADCQSECSMDI